jgi:hypothetical protein
LAEFFVAGVTARTEADLLGVNRKTAYFYHRLRQIIAQEVDRGSPLAGHIEVDESYFGGHRVIPPFLTGLSGRIYAASFSFWAGVIPPMPMFGRSLL